MSWQFSSDRPIYLQIIDRLYMDILTGKYPPSTQIPPVRTLAIDAGVNPNTMQKALSEMEREGILESHRGEGRFVCIDEQKLAEMKNKIVLEKGKHFLGELRELQLTNGEIEAFLQQLLMEGNHE